MQIGGCDILIPTKLTLETAFHIVLDIFYEKWPNIVLEFVKDLNYYREFFIYPNKEEYEVEFNDKDNFSKKMIACMINYCKHIKSNYVSLVIDNREDEEINTIIDVLKEKLGETK